MPLSAPTSKTLEESIYVFVFVAACIRVFSLSIGTASVSGAAIEEELIVISSKTTSIAIILCISVGALAWWFNGSMAQWCGF